MTTRRRFLTILAGASAVSLVGIKAASATESWRGIALGAEAHVILDHPDAARLIPEAVVEIRRLENIFSLYKAESQLSRLNREGVLQAPAFEFVELLSACSALNAQTSGAFDPTIQPLWALYAQAFSAGASPGTAEVQQTKNLVGWKNVRFDPASIQYRKPGMAMTLNGVAQGFIADQITAFFRQHGIKNVLVNTGEISALGTAPDGMPWPIKLQDDGRTVPLVDAAIATSSSYGTVFDVAGNVGHIIDPRTGYPGGNWTSVSVISSSAAQADGLSTAFCLMTSDEIKQAAGTNEVLLGTSV